MRIAVMGAGAVGGYYGALLARSGHEVIFVARGAHLQALRSSGLRIVGDDESFRVSPVTAVADPSEAGTVDVIVFCVKVYDLESAALACLPMLGDRTYALTLQNGVESVDIASSVLGPGRVLGGATYIVASLESPGLIRRTGPWGRIEAAEPSGEVSERARELERICKAAGIDFVVRRDMQTMLWSKFILVSATSAMTALTRQTIGVIREDEVMSKVAEACIEETSAVGRALGVELGPETEADALYRFKHDISGRAKASQLVDLERGKPLELEHLSGAVHRLGEKVGVPTPVHTTVYAALKPFVHGTRK